MTVITIEGFTGENRAAHPKTLGPMVGVTSLNQKPGRGDLRPWRVPLTVATVPVGRKTIYRMGRDVDSDANYWLSWANRVHAVRGFNADDTTEQTYYTGDGAPKVTNNIIALSSAPYPMASRPLGIPAPTTALIAATNSGTWTGLSKSYYYVYTYVNDWGWESAPSPVSAESVRPTDATVALSGFGSLPSGNYQINRIRIYRTQTGTSGATEFFFLREVAVGVSTTTDDGRDLGEVLPTTTWVMTPDDLSMLTPMWNGMLAGISGNGVRICEPYTPYAWPIAYEVLPPDSKPVALGVFGQTLLVLTTARPLVVSGSSPDSMDQMPLEMYQGCIAPESVVGMGIGVAWASEDGLCWYGAGGPRILTAGLMLREDWQKLKPSTIVGKMYEGLYFGTFDAGAGLKAFLIDPMNPTGIYFMDTGYAAMHFDELKDQLYVLDSSGNVQRWDAGTAFMTTKFRSKVFQQPRVTSFAAAELVCDVYPATFRADAVGLNEDEAAKILASLSAVPGVSCPTPTSVRYTKVVTSRDAFRLPTISALDWQFELETANNVQLANIATSMVELASV
ncbi:hypothetical protein B9Z51_08620 [Limnohabitans sp. T6-5]|uniref:hypothetical protein n=1 Tax=Limnohabitans sp. T6-5 TaxID=1100724 RepID=UPI000D343ECA|nr:hypothetical protein [Limnohabitans sp. T6-5]PUE08987.1 hypothetical protein B9Z51_08620 [Limnohabitans sp. T6-5]